MAGAQDMRVDQAAEANDDRADRRPPHPMDRQFVEYVFDPLERRRQQHCLKADQKADAGGGEQAPA
tara:strand:+ start:6983 stop:7180 length:198 start_codon:yes stop_codon:yes gene_type:complete